MMKKRIIISILGLLLLIGIVAGVSKHEQARQIPNQHVPTFFFHGWGSSYHAEENMTAAIKRAGASDTIVRVNVSRHGHTKIIGTIPRHAKNPLVEVNFADNKLGNLHGSYAHAYYTTGAKYVQAAITAVTKKYHYSTINVVSHSMGNLEFANYLVRYHGQADFPKIAHWVSMAGHYNGIVGINDRPNRTKIAKKTGRPSRMEPEFKALLGLRKTFPKTARVLNIYGNLENGTNSDGDVTNASSRSLRYLLNGRAKSYQELMIKGRQGQHSHLHHNRQVNQALLNFIWK